VADIYDRALGTATRMLNTRANGGYGDVAVLTVTTIGEYDPDTGTAPVTTTEYTGSAFRDTFKREEVDGVRVLATDVKFLVSPKLANGNAAPDLNPEYRINFDGQDYIVVNVMPWNYAGLTVGFEVQARK
jgi:hypothetical protein